MPGRLRRAPTSLDVWCGTLGPAVVSRCDPQHSADDVGFGLAAGHPHRGRHARTGLKAACTGLPDAGQKFARQTYSDPAWEPQHGEDSQRARKAPDTSVWRPDRQSAWSETFTRSGFGQGRRRSAIAFPRLTIFHPRRYGAPSFGSHFPRRIRWAASPVLVRLRPSPLQPNLGATAKMRSPLWSSWSATISRPATEPSSHGWTVRSR